MRRSRSIAASVRSALLRLANPMPWKITQATSIAVDRANCARSMWLMARCRARPGQSRSSSLIPVFERVCASTVLTITAQYSEGPALPSGRALPGSAPGTTTL